MTRCLRLASLLLFTAPSAFAITLLERIIDHEKGVIPYPLEKLSLLLETAPQQIRLGFDGFSSSSDPSPSVVTN